MSFLKKLMKKKDEEQKPNSGPGVQTMSAELQMKYAKGVQYNMKVIIKGDRNVGKSSLFLRLQGQKFREEYLPTDEIQVANIQWNYKTTDDVVKVEVWDVVDKARRKPSADSGLKMKHKPGEDDNSPRLDAQFVDVYKGTHAVIMMYDMTKLWTWQYVEKEIHNVPAHIPVVILANNRDMGDHRTVVLDTTRYFVSSLERGEAAAPVRFTETSLLNGFGLKYLHAFFNVPFLLLQKDTLLKQLDVNTRETAAIEQELDMLGESNYDKIVEAGEIRRAGASNSTSAIQKRQNTLGASAPPPSNTLLVNHSLSKGKASRSVDDFQPDLAGDTMDFFGAEDTKQSSLKRTSHKQTTSDEDDDVDGSNPMVATFQDDLDSSDDDQMPAVNITSQTSRAPAVSVKIASADVILSSDEENKDEEKSAGSDSESEHANESALDRLTQQFNHVVGNGSRSQTAAHRQEPISSSDADDDDIEAPSILADEDVVSDSDNQKKKRMKKVTKAAALPSSRDMHVVLTDSDDDSNRPAVMQTEQVSSDEGIPVVPSVQLPDIAISHQTTKDSAGEQKPIKKKKKTRKEKTTLEGEDDPKPKKKTKKSKHGEGDVSKDKERKKKSKSKSAPPDAASSKAVLDPLERFLAGDSDTNDYECL